MKVYIVTAGEYSDYGIQKVFLDQDKAEKYAKYRNGYNSWDDYRVEEYDTFDDEYAVIEKEPTYHRFRIELMVKSNHKGVFSTSIVNMDHTITDNQCHENFKKYNSGRKYYCNEYMTPNGKSNLTVYCWFEVKDENSNAEWLEVEDKAEKIAEDFAGQVANLLAQGLEASDINDMNLKETVNDQDN